MHRQPRDKLGSSHSYDFGYWRTTERQTTFLHSFTTPHCAMWQLAQSRKMFAHTGTQMLAHRMRSVRTPVRFASNRRSKSARSRLRFASSKCQPRSGGSSDLPTVFSSVNVTIQCGRVSLAKQEHRKANTLCTSHNNTENTNKL